MTGEPSHFEIGVPDTDRARKFYGKLLGWTFEPTDHGARIKSAGGLSGGIHREENGASLQIFYVVPDLDEAAKSVIELGGEVDEGGGEGPAGKWLYSCRDDQGVPFGLHEPGGK
jgi:predicted enzyme related to lactoylglutathione lyase